MNNRQLQISGQPVRVPLRGVSRPSQLRPRLPWRLHGQSRALRQTPETATTAHGREKTPESSRVRGTTPPRRGITRAFSLEGIHAGSSRTAKSIGPSARTVPDDACGMKRAEIPRYTTPRPQKRAKMSWRRQRKWQKAQKKGPIGLQSWRTTLKILISRMPPSR